MGGAAAAVPTLLVHATHRRLCSASSHGVAAVMPCCLHPCCCTSANGPLLSLLLPELWLTLLDCRRCHPTALQHCTWNRLLALSGVALLLWLTWLWTPVREFLQAIRAGPQQPLAPPPPPAAGAGAAAAAAGAAPVAVGGGVGAGAGGGGGGAAGPPGSNRGSEAGARPGGVQRGGVLWEVLTIIVGFVTSLLPGWNHNPEDAAMFAAAQEMLAREVAAERMQQQQQQQRRQGDDGEEQ